MHEYLENPQELPLERQGANLAEAFIYGDLYGYSPDQSMLLFSISPNFTTTDFDKIMGMMAGIKEIMRKIQKHFPDLEIGYTGDVPIQADEQDAMRLDMIIPAIVALIVILLLFIFSFNQLRAILFTLITLVFGIVFTYGCSESPSRRST